MLWRIYFLWFRSHSPLCSLNTKQISASKSHITHVKLIVDAYLFNCFMESGQFIEPALKAMETGSTAKIRINPGLGAENRHFFWTTSPKKFFRTCRKRHTGRIENDTKQNFHFTNPPHSREISHFFTPKHFATPKNRRTFALANQTQCRETSGNAPKTSDGPFVYRLGREIFIL